MIEITGAQIHVTGVVQGVGFRPFVYGLALRLGVTGWVRNTSAGVDIVVNGAPKVLSQFVESLSTEAPPLARIDDITVSPCPADSFSEFKIIHSQAISTQSQPISPDVCVCEDCLRELFDPHNRRYHYPFINCTNCGPRFTIIQDIPYDRPNTTMAGFPMCLECTAEYNDPLDRRFHAQPVACPVCGPKIWLEMDGLAAAPPQTEQVLGQAQELLLGGKIIAIKGLGGFHLACDATNQSAVTELRRRKLRVEKPFALMMRDLDVVEQHCYLDPSERALLSSRERPIVLLKRRPDSPIAFEVAPNQDTLGVMLPYSPLHYLLFEPFANGAAGQESQASIPPLVMTSGNLSEEPIATDNEEARQRLASLADAFLLHDRPIHIRCDDSVVRAVPKEIILPAKAGQAAEVVYPVRRSRGYAPFPVHVPWKLIPLLAAGAELKNTFCVTRDQYAILSHHIGDLVNYETLKSFEQGVAHYERLFRVSPQALVYDLHPDYLSTRYVQQRSELENIPAIGVQHHHAHIAACMVENKLPEEEPVIGVSFDGTGYGLDDAIWGGEFLIAGYRDFERAAHLAYVPLPGGDKAVREPFRMALAYLHQFGIDWQPDLPPVRYAASRPGYLEVLEHQLARHLNAPLTSSMGRLFDAAAALIGVQQTINYEAQAAIELESLVDTSENGRYHLELVQERAAPILIVAAPMFQELIVDLKNREALPVMAARIHNALAWMVSDVCCRLRANRGINTVVFSGGVWQNQTLLSKAYTVLAGDGFRVYIHRQVPTNDGGISLGQAAVAFSRLK